MADAYTQLVNSPIGGFVARNLGLPQPVELDRYEPGAPLIDGRVLVGSAPGGRCGDAVAAVLADAGSAVDSRLDDEVRAALGGASVDAGVWNPEAPGRPALQGPRLRRHRDRDSAPSSASSGRFFHPTIRRLEPCGRLIVLGRTPSGLRRSRARRPPSARSRASSAPPARRSATAATAQLI